MNDDLESLLEQVGFDYGGEGRFRWHGDYQLVNRKGEVGPLLNRLANKYALLTPTRAYLLYNILTDATAKTLPASVKVFLGDTGWLVRVRTSEKFNIDAIRSSVSSDRRMACQIAPGIINLYSTRADDASPYRTMHVPLPAETANYQHTSGREHADALRELVGVR